MALLALLVGLAGCGQGAVETAERPQIELLPAVALDTNTDTDLDTNTGLDPNNTTGRDSKTAAAERFEPTDLPRHLGLPVDLRIPEATRVAAIAVHVGRDDTRREIYSLTVELGSDAPPEELTDTLNANPVLPSRGVDIPLPTFDYFYDWSNPSVRVEPDGGGSIATVSTSTRRQGQDAGNGIAPGAATTLLHQLADERGLPMWSSGSSIRWTILEPETLGASVSFGGLAQDRAQTMEWLRLHAEPGTLQSTFAVSERDDRFDGTIETVLAGNPEATATWRGGSSRDSMWIEFSYETGSDGHPTPGQTIAVAPELPVLVPAKSSWLIDDDGVRDDAWYEPAFDDAAWGRATAPLVRDEPVRDAGRIATPASGDPAWFRFSFEVEDPASIAALELSFLADDAAVFYLNGSELHRWNLPEGPISAETFAINRISGEDEEVLHVVGDLPADLVVAGRNVLAVSLLQSSASSSDARFDAQLVAWPVAG